MGQPAVKLGDKVQAMCVGHQIPGPAGAPAPAPPLPFSAPLTQGLATTVLVEGQPAAVVGSSGYNLPPHVGLHPSDPKLVPVTQQAAIVSGSASVLFGGQPAAHSGSSATACLSPQPAVLGTGASVLVGG